MSLVVRADVNNTAEDALNSVVDMVDNVNEELIAAMTAVRREVMLAFDDQIDINTGSPWQDLADSTKKQRLKRKTSKKKQRVFSGLQILVDSGELRRSVDAKYNNIFEAGKNQVIFGTDKDYGVFHQYGTKRKLQPGEKEEDRKEKMPARPFLPEGVKLQEIFMPEFVDLLEQKISKTYD